MTNSLIAIASFLRERREAIGLSQADTAARAGLFNQQTIWKLENQRRGLGFVEAVHLARALRFEITALAELVESPFSCLACLDVQPIGFTCNTCGRSG